MKDLLIWFIAPTFSLVISLLMLWVSYGSSHKVKVKEGERFMLMKLTPEQEELFARTMSLLEFKDIGELTVSALSLYVVITDQVLAEGKLFISFPDGRMMELQTIEFKKLRKQIAED